MKKYIVSDIAAVLFWDTPSEIVTKLEMALSEWHQIEYYITALKILRWQS